MAVLVGAAAACAAVWLYLALGRGSFWRCDIELPVGGPSGVRAEPWPAVAVLVPARDEAAVLAATLPRLLEQDYAGPVRVVLVNDRSTDATSALARAIGQAPGVRVPLTVVDGTEPPPGWVGKLWALEQAWSLPQVAGAEYLLLTDADISHPPSSLRRLVGAASGQGLDMVSLMAKLSAERGWERLIIPAFVYFFAQLYPFRWVNRAGSATAAAAGGCVLVRRAALEGCGGFGAIRGAVIDDVSLARMVKRSGSQIWLGLAADVQSVRGYGGLRPLWSMVARSAFVQLHCSALLLLATVAGLTFLYLLPVGALAAGVATGNPGLGALGGLAWLVMAGTYLPMLRYYRRWPGGALMLPFTASLYLAMTVDSARRHWSGRGVWWRGQPYASPTRPP